MTTKKVYMISLGTIFIASAYPLYMGSVMVFAYMQNGGIDVADYPSYIIPYTPISIALIVCTAMLPLILRLCKRFALIALTVLGIALFLAAEIMFEQIAVFTDVSSKMKIEIWQMLSCVMTPQVSNSVWDSLNIRYNPSFKIHFYAIAILIVLSVIGVIYGFYKMAQTQDFKKKKPLTAQLISVLVFIGLCVLACFTAFFRTGDINLSPLSAFLMTAFFLVFGITAGVYIGTWLYGKKKMISIIIPSIVAILITVVMYIGEMIMMGWTLFQRGTGFLFDRLWFIPLSFFDIITILFSGIITYFVLTVIKPKVEVFSAISIISKVEDKNTPNYT